MKSVLNVLSGNILDPQPIWLMRQAGRYLPEYRDVRARAGSFLNLVYTPDLAAEVTMQPIRRFGFDAAILFSDILVVPHAMGVDVTFEAGEGPRLIPVTERDDLKKFDDMDPHKIWAPVFETVQGVREKLNHEGFDNTSLIGFAGAPWTVACYMVSGSGQNHQFPDIIKMAKDHYDFLNRLIEHITHSTILYLQGQINAGAEIIQIFDSWAGMAHGTLFDQFVIDPTQKIVQALRASNPLIPIIGFPRLAGARLFDYIHQTKITAVQGDEDFDFQKIRDINNLKIITQGNLNPDILLKGGDDLDRAVEKIKKETQEHPHIFNLSHGIIKETPLAHVEQLMTHFKK